MHRFDTEGRERFHIFRFDPAASNHLHAKVDERLDPCTSFHGPNGAATRQNGLDSFVQQHVGIRQGILAGVNGTMPNETLGMTGCVKHGIQICLVQCALLVQPANHHALGATIEHHLGFFGGPCAF